MRIRRVVLALVIAVAFAVPAAAQSDDARLSLNATVGPSFFVHRDESTPRVHRLTTGLTFSLKEFRE